MASHDPSAETALREAVRLEPELPAAHHNLATVLVARGDWAEAEYHLERAIENNPSEGLVFGSAGGVVQIYLDYAAILAQRGLYERARNYLDEALKLDPRRPDAHSLMGEILASDGNRAIDPPASGPEAGEILAEVPFREVS